MRHPNGMAAERNSECETPGWNDGGEGIPGVRHPDGMSYVTHREGADHVQGRESHVAFF